MELMHPTFLQAGLFLIVIAAAATHYFRKKYAYHGGAKAANTWMLKAMPEFRASRMRHLVLAIIAEVCIVLAALACVVLASRPYRTQTVSQGVKKRDIFLCMDVSYSIYELNRELVDALKNVVAGLHGDRFGISIFNTSTVLYVPMTDDYDFVMQKLDELGDYFSLQKEYVEKYWENVPYEEYDAFDALQRELDYYDAGTLIDNTIRGSSLIGEGLASCMYSFPRFGDEERTRVIIMSTDNAQSARGTPLIELKEASDLCKKNEVIVFGIFPDTNSFLDYMITDGANYDSLKTDFRRNVEKTGGAYYEQSSSLSVDAIVKNIQAHEAMETGEVTTTKAVDLPEAALVLLLIMVAGMLVCGIVMNM